jgi:mono/diheme cytochrome c family protein
MNQFLKHHIVALVTLSSVLTIGAGVFVYSGLYNIGADDYHTKPVFMVLQTLRDHSIQHRSKDLIVPNLEDPQLILKGAGQYAAMCTSCHLAPGMHDSEIRPGLYPQPPNLSQQHFDAKAEFWVIKHGLKMSAMPAWGGSHDDATIWSMVAFLQKMPNMTPQQYKDMIAKAPPDEDMDMDAVDSRHDNHHHSHSDNPSDNHDVSDMHGMDMSPKTTH